MQLLRQLLEMPERIAQQEITIPWQSINTTKTHFESVMVGTPEEYVLKCHPMKTGPKSVILVYSGRNVIAGMSILLTFGANPTAEVSGLLVSKGARGSGIALSIYLTLVTRVGITVVSDDVQTPGGAAIWKKLSSLYPAKVGVTDREVADVMPLDQWTDGDPFTHHFTRLVFSPNDIVLKRRKRVA